MRRYGIVLFLLVATAALGIGVPELRAQGPFSAQIRRALDAWGLTTPGVFTGTLDITSTAADALDVAGGIQAGSGDVAIINAAGKLTALTSTYLNDLSGAALTSLDAGNISAGTLATARLPVITTLGVVSAGEWQSDDIAVSYGGTGQSTFTDGGVLLGNGTGGLQAMAVLADGVMVVGDGSTDPVAESGATLRTSIGVGTGDSPQFSGANITTLNATNISSGTLATARLPAVMTGITSVDMGTTTVYGSRAITVDTGGVLDVVLASAAGDDFTVDTDKIVVSGDSDYVGIGVTDPDVNLDVSGGDNVLNIFRITQRASGAAAYGLQVGLDSNGDTVWQRLVNDTATESFRMVRGDGNVTFSGDVGVGANADTALHLHHATPTFFIEATGSTDATIILEDNDEAGCTSITALNGALVLASVSCP